MSKIKPATNGKPYLQKYLETNRKKLKLITVQIEGQRIYSSLNQKIPRKCRSHQTH